MRVEIADSKLATLLETTRTQAQQRLDARDIEGALRVWREVLEQQPGNADVRREVEKLEQALEKRDKAELHQEVLQLVERLEAGLKTGRYGS